MSELPIVGQQIGSQSEEKEIEENAQKEANVCSTKELNEWNGGDKRRWCERFVGSKQCQMNITWIAIKQSDLDTEK